MLARIRFRLVFIGQGEITLDKLLAAAAKERKVVLDHEVHLRFRRVLRHLFWGV